MPERLRTLSDANDLNPWPEEQYHPGSITPVARVHSTESTSMDQRTPATISTTQHGTDSIITLETSSLPHSQGYTLKVSLETGLNLINGFFNHIHCFLPLFHPTRFKEKYASLNYLKGEQDCSVTLESALIFNSIFCLAARFSTASKLSAEEPLHRGDQFATEAARLFEVLYRQLEDDHPSLACLQGVILLAFNALLSGPGPSRRAWWLTGVCVRLAYELDLHNTDADIICGEVDPLQLPFEAWQDREERRRAW